MSADLDPRWEWVEITMFGLDGPTYIRGRCNHLEIVPVPAASGEVVAHLCLTCDTQLPEEWTMHETSDATMAARRGYRRTQNG